VQHIQYADATILGTVLMTIIIFNRKNTLIYSDTRVVCPIFVNLSIIVEITIKSTNEIKYGIAYL